MPWTCRVPNLRSRGWPRCGPIRTTTRGPYDDARSSHVLWDTAPAAERVSDGARVLLDVLYECLLVHPSHRGTCWGICHRHIENTHAYTDSNMVLHTWRYGVRIMMTTAVMLCGAAPRQVCVYRGKSRWISSVDPREWSQTSIFANGYSYVVLEAETSTEHYASHQCSMTSGLLGVRGT